MQKSKQFYEDFFNKYPVTVHNNPARFSAVADLLRGKVIDVACGTGTLADYYAGSYVGVDFAQSAIDKAFEVRRKDARFFVADFAKDAFSVSEKYDSAYLGEFLEHIENDNIVFQNLIDLLSPNGRIVVSVPNSDRVSDESHCRAFTVPQIRRDYSKYGKITFHNWSGFSERLLFSIELGQKNDKKVTLAMVVKDEAKGIENAIISALPLVDWVVVSIDTATEDETYNLVKLYADQIKFHEWHDNFSEIRNAVQELVLTPWTLFLDGHEYVEQTGKIEDFLKLDVDGILVTIKMENGLTFMYPRFFKSYLRFENAVHNAIDCNTTQAEPNFVIVHDRLNAQHEKSSKARQVQRDRMIPDEMQKALKKNANDQRALFNLANWHMTKNNLKLALKYYKLCARQTSNLDELYFITAQIGIAQQLLGQNLRATWTFFSLEKLIADRWETKRLLGCIFIAREDYKKAVDYLVYALTPNEKKFLYQLFEHNLAEIWDMIALCFLQLEQFQQAIIAWREAIKNTSDDKRKDFFATKIGFCEMFLPVEKGKV